MQSKFDIEGSMAGDNTREKLGLLTKIVADTGDLDRQETQAFDVPSGLHLPLQVSDGPFVCFVRQHPEAQAS